MARIINIDQDDIKLIKSVLGYPAVDNIILTDEQIIDLCLYRAMLKYFEFFPMQERFSKVSQYETIVDFPNDVYGVLDARYVGKDGYGTNRTSSTFLDIVRYQSMGSGGYAKGSFGTPYGFGGNEYNYLNNKLHRNSLMQSNETFKIYIDRSNRKVVAYSTMRATLNITWAKTSNDFNDIKFEEKLKVIDLSSAYLLRQLSDTGSIMEDNDSSKKLNISELKSRAEELERPILEYWQSIPSIFISR